MSQTTFLTHLFGAQPESNMQLLDVNEQALMRQVLFVGIWEAGSHPSIDCKFCWTKLQCDNLDKITRDAENAISLVIHLGICISLGSGLASAAEHVVADHRHPQPQSIQMQHGHGQGVLQLVSLVREESFHNVLAC